MARFRVLLNLVEYPLLVRLDVVVGLSPDVDANLLVVPSKELNCLEESFLLLIGPEIRFGGRCWLDRWSFEFLLLGIEGLYWSNVKHPDVFLALDEEATTPHLISSLALNVLANLLVILVE